MNKKIINLFNLLLLITLSTLVFSSIAIPTSQNQDNDIVLITGFKPFDVYDINPSEQITIELNNTIFQNYTIKGYVLPVNYTAAPAKMKQLINTFDPVMIIALGLAGNAETIQVETLGVNLRINPEQPFPLLTLRTVNRTGPWIQKATYDIPKILSNIKKEEIPVEQSYSAGLYLCNAILYETLLFESASKQMIPIGFIHVPQLNTQHPNGMPLDDMIRSVHVAINAQLH